MLKRVSISFIFFLLASSSNLIAQFSGGLGSIEDPYQVATIEQLQDLRNFTNKHFILINDIDASMTITWNDSAGFTPIGDEILKFTGQLDGNGYSISNLVINRSDEFNVGLFGVTNNAELSNIVLENVVIKGADYVGGLAGLNTNTNIYNSKADSIRIEGKNSVGGLIGRNEGGYINRSNSSGWVTGEERTGGLVGINAEAGIIQDSYSSITIIGDLEAGGVVGTNTADSNNPSIIRRSFATGVVTGTDDTGALVGLNAGTLSYAYYDSTIANGLVGVGRGFREGLLGLTTDEMSGLNAYFSMISFDFVDYWLLTNSYPALAWEQVDFLPTPPSAITLLSPEDEEGDFRFNYEFKWEGDKWASSYSIQISENEAFSVLEVDTMLSDSLYTLENSLKYITQYYWRVKGINESEDGPWSDVYSFTTINAPKVGITYVWPKTAVPGSTIKIYGAKLAGFTPNSDSTTVKIGSKTVEVVSASYNIIEAIVPEGLTGVQDVTLDYPGGSKTLATPITILKNGEVNFASSYVIGGDQTYFDVEIVDLNSDRKMDIVALEYHKGENRSMRFLSTSSGYVKYSNSTFAGGYQSADFNTDGNIDIVFSNSPSTGIGFFWGNGVGGWSRGGLASGYGEYYYIFIFDRDTDGDFDLNVKTGSNSNYGFWALNRGNGSFQVNYFEDEQTFPGFSSSQRKFADMDEDGDMDIIVKGNDVYWRENIDGTDFGEARVLVNWNDFTNSINSYDVCDIDGDGDVDIAYSVTGSGSTGEIGWYENLGIDNFVKKELIKESVDGESVIAQCADFDGDGDQDIFSNREWFKNNGTGDFELQESFVNSGSGLQAVDFDGDGDLDIFGLLSKGMVIHENLAINVSLVHESVAFKYKLQQNYPNPFNPVTNINYSIPRTENVEITVYNVLGKKIATLVDELKIAGFYTITFDGSNLSSGVYYYRINAGSFSETKKLTLIK